MAIAMLLAPASPLPAAPQHRDTYRPQTGEAVSPRTQQLFRAATARVRGPIGASATVGPNAAQIGAPGIGGLAASHAKIVDHLAVQSIRAPSHLGRSVDKKA